MGMRRIEAESQPLSPTVKPLKPVPDFDDSSIRKMLRSAYIDFVGEELEMQMNQDPQSSMAPNMSFTADKGWADLSQLHNRAELKLFWDMFIQKQIFIFEQESALLIEVSKEDNW
ncbi:MAG: hypothetical protein ACRD2L_19995 [Terriglobia bacterium]